MKGNFFNLQRFAKKINLTSKADDYENSTTNRIIYALAGNDTVQNYASKVTIFGGAGNDYIKNDGSNLTVNGGDSVKISGGAGKDSIVNYEADSVSISGGAGADQIKTWWSDNVTIAGGTGDDSIQLGAYETLESEYAKNTVIKYASGDGNDTIFGFDSNDTLYITKGKYSTSVKGNNFIVTVGKQKIILKDAVGDNYQKVIIKNSSGELDIYNDWSIKTANSNGETITANNVTIKSAKSGSYITSWGDNVRIIGNNGVDNISNSGNNVTISGGKGKDVITSGGDKVSISAGTGNDEITSTGDKATVNGGKGNDYIYLGYVDQYSADSQKTIVRYASGDGKDTIRGFNATDTIKITSGKYSASSNSDNNVIVKVGSGSITLLNATDQNIYITDADGKTTKHYFPSTGANISELLTENNFSTADNLSSIIENNLTPTDYKVETQNFENLITESNLITYSNK